MDHVLTQSNMSISVRMVDDFHVHLRQGPMMHAVVPLIRRGGCGRVYVMPNLNPPISTVEQAVAYRDQLKAIEPKVEFWMTLYLTSRTTPEEIREAASAGIKGVKVYPHGVTTNSEFGVDGLQEFYPVFEAMQTHNLVLNLHGEAHNDSVTVLTAEEAFLPELVKLHAAFPKLRIVLEHVTSAAAVEVVKSLGDTVAATITVHHLDLTMDDWAGKSVNYCKPVAKTPADRKALREVVQSGNHKFFLGTDSAPHPLHLKNNAKGAPAGVFTTPYVLPYLATIFEELRCLDKLQGFTSEYGAKFYRVPLQTKLLELIREPQAVQSEFKFGADNETDESKKGSIVPFWADRTLPWHVVLHE